MKHDFSDVASDEEAVRLGKLYPIILEKHNAKWKEYFEEEKAFLQSVIGETVLHISHIGSTAVPGIIAKPTIDILLEVRDNTDLSAFTPKMLDNGYFVNNPPKDLIMYIKGYGKNGFEGQAFHIHVRNYGNHDELYFRDYLIKHPETAREYEVLKINLKQKYEHDRDGYTAAKGDFIKRITALARKALEGEIHNDK